MPDNTKSVCESSKLIGITEMPIDVLMRALSVFGLFSFTYSPMPEVSKVSIL